VFFSVCLLHVMGKCENAQVNGFIKMTENHEDNRCVPVTISDKMKHCYFFFYK